MAYGLYSVVVGSERLEKPDEAWELFSPRFIYKNIASGVDEGGLIFSTTRPNAISTVKSLGCASLATCPYGNGPKDWLNADLPVASKIEARMFAATEFKRVSNLDILKRTLASGIPVILGVETDSKFMSNTNDGVYRFVGDNVQRKHKYHAILAVGYDDNQKAIRVLNSWGKKWKDNGLCWVSYESLKTIAPSKKESRNWCFEAYAVWVRRDTFPKVASDGDYRLELTRDGDVIWLLKDGQRISTDSGGSVEDICSTLEEIYIIRDGTVSVWAEYLSENGSVQRHGWYDISSENFPNGLHHVNGEMTKAKMIATSPKAIYILGDNGIVYGRFEGKMITESKWEKHELPQKVQCVDLRHKGTVVYATSAKGQVYERKPGVGWALVNQ